MSGLGLGFGVGSVGLRVWGLDFGVLGLGFRVSDVGLTVFDFESQC